ncbi:multidrug efflux pump subunit AcrA (membrane-fusion protein) [Sphingomonas melonis]|uniref:Multidrug efflux pump subunit AcrA (Membrane-fusion protein) n=2 Tax=Sphingomonas melonis TaxID=152682 RepID=A0A7Y9JZU2_9SPHN|nr:multidrug efflux pump subunit AcrA (membrane-fusion protein) [Sphingomonas melonis]
MGDAATVRLASGAEVVGHVRLIGARVDPQTGLVRVRLALPVRPDIRPGGFAQADFASNSRAVLTVPEAAVRYGASGATVQTLDRRNAVRSRPVRVGRRGGGYVELTSGPPPGTRVVLGGGAFVLDGDVVRPTLGSGR